MATSTKNQDKLELLRDILLPEEHKALEELSERILRLEKQELQQNELIRKNEGELTRKLRDHKDQVSDLLRSELRHLLRSEIQRDPEAMAEIFQPLATVLLANREKAKKKAKIERRTAPFKILNSKWRSFTARFMSGSAVKKAEKQLKAAAVAQTFVINRKSGNLRASLAEQELLNKSKISVICGVINDHIQKHSVGKDQHLSVLAYGPYQIYIQGFIKHYVAMVIPGRKELNCKEKMQDVIFSFYYEFMSKNLDLLHEGDIEKTEKKIINRTLLDKAMEKNITSGKL